MLHGCGLLPCVEGPASLHNWGVFLDSLPGQPDHGGRRVLFGSFLPGKCRAEDSLDFASWNNFTIHHSFSFCLFPILIFRGEPHTVYILILQPCKYHLNSLCDITEERRELPVVIY